MKPYKGDAGWDCVASKQAYIESDTYKDITITIPPNMPKDDRKFQYLLLGRSGKYINKGLYVKPRICIGLAGAPSIVECRVKNVNKDKACVVDVGERICQFVVLARKDPIPQNKQINTLYYDDFDLDGPTCLDLLQSCRMLCINRFSIDNQADAFLKGGGNENEGRLKYDLKFVNEYIEEGGEDMVGLLISKKVHNWQPIIGVIDKYYMGPIMAMYRLTDKMDNDKKPAEDDDKDYWGHDDDVRLVWVVCCCPSSSDNSKEERGVRGFGSSDVV
jgi:dUTPase